MKNLNIIERLTVMLNSSMLEKNVDLQRYAKRIVEEKLLVDELDRDKEVNKYLQKSLYDKLFIEEDINREGIKEFIVDAEEQLGDFLDIDITKLPISYLLELNMIYKDFRIAEQRFNMIYEVYKEAKAEEDKCIFAYDCVLREYFVVEHDEDDYTRLNRLNIIIYNGDLYYLTDNFRIINRLANFVANVEGELKLVHYKDNDCLNQRKENLEIVDVEKIKEEITDSIEDSKKELEELSKLNIAKEEDIDKIVAKEEERVNKILEEVNNVLNPD